MYFEDKLTKKWSVQNVKIIWKLIELFVHWLLMLKVYEIIEENNVIFQTAFNLDLSDGGWRLVPGNSRPSKKSADARGRVLRRGVPVAHSGCTVSPTAPSVLRLHHHRCLNDWTRLYSTWRKKSWIYGYNISLWISDLSTCIHEASYIFVEFSVLVWSHGKSNPFTYRLADSKFLCTFTSNSI